MKKYLFLVLLISLSASVNAQSPAKAVFVELGGPGLASFNYDMRFTKSESGFGGRAGIGGFSLGTKNNRATAIFIPVGLNYIVGKDDRQYFEFGAGITPVIISSSYTNGTVGTNEKFENTFGYIDIGYRLQPKEGGFFFRAVITPIFNKAFFWPYYGGVSFGYKF